MKVLVVTGSSGGHIFPAVSFIQALKEKNSQAQVLLVLPARGLKPGRLLADCKIKYISTSTITTALSSANLLAIARFLKATWESLILTLKFKPDLAIGFGSLDSIPCVFISWFFRIKTLIHEQNVLPGKANRLLAHFVDRIAISFAKSENYFKVDREKLVLTGNPLRQQIKKIDQEKAREFFGLAKDKFTILVMGGSQGSRQINSGFLSAVTGLNNPSAVQVIHLAGPQDNADIQEGYRKINLAAKVFDFLGDIEQAYSSSDLVICRAGAATVSELIFYQLPAIISPYPFAYSHQLENALVLKNKGCAIVVNDADLGKDIFQDSLQELIDNRGKLESMRSGFSDLPAESAAELLAEAALTLK